MWLRWKWRGATARLKIFQSSSRSGWKGAEMCRSWLGDQKDSPKLANKRPPYNSAFPASPCLTLWSVFFLRSSSIEPGLSSADTPTIDEPSRNCTQPYLGICIAQEVRDSQTKSYVARIASEKSFAAQTLSGKSKAVLAADTEVIIDDLILGKPSSLTDAISMLTRLSGRTHQVITAVSLRYLNHHWSSLSISEVKFRDIHPLEIETYWASGEPKDKAGAYAIQGLGSVFVQNMEGSFSGIVGLPIYETSILLDKVGIRPPFLTERP